MSCAFCLEFETGIFPPIETSRLLYESDQFCIFPGVGQIVEGYLLLASREHFIGIGSLPLLMFRELEHLMQTVRSVLTKHYTVPIFFEHGPASPTHKGGCCIEHAHVHALPAFIDVLNELAAQFPVHRMQEMSQLQALFAQGTPYLFWEGNNQQRYVFEVMKPIPSQYLRRVVAQKLGRADRWDWRTSPGLDELKQTLQRLKSEFQSLGVELAR